MIIKYFVYVVDASHYPVFKHQAPGTKAFQGEHSIFTHLVSDAKGAFNKRAQRSLFFYFTFSSFAPRLILLCNCLQLPNVPTTAGGYDDTSNATNQG